MILRISTVLPSFVAFQFISLQVASGNEPPVLKTCEAVDECRVSYEYLSSQEADPFLFLGKVVDGSHPRYSAYKKAIRNFPNTQSCLTEPERLVPNPNLLKFDWPNLRNQKDLEVCLFRVFRSIGSQEAIRAWLEFHEFEVHGPVRRYSANYVPSFAQEPLYRIDASWDSAGTMRHRPSLFWRLTGLTLVHATSVSIGLSENDEIVDLRVTAIIE